MEYNETEANVFVWDLYYNFVYDSDIYSILFGKAQCYSYEKLFLTIKKLVYLVRRFWEGF